MLSALSMVSGLSVSAVQRWWFLRAAFAPSCSVSQSLAQSLHLVAVPCAFLTPSESARAPSVSAAANGFDRFLRTVSVSGSVAVSVPVGIFVFIGEQATAPRTLPLQARRGCRSSETFPGWPRGRGHWRGFCRKPNPTVNEEAITADPAVVGEAFSGDPAVVK